MPIWYPTAKCELCFIFFFQEKDVREIKEESDEEDMEGVEANVEMTLHGGVSLEKFI